MQIKHFTRQTFFILICGFFTLFICGFFIFNAYWRLNHSYLTPNRIANRIVKIVKLARSIQPEQAKKALPFLREPGIHLRLTLKPKKIFLPIYPVNVNVIRQQVLKNPNHVRLTFPIGKKYFLHISTHIFRPVTVKIQFAAALAVWLIALISLCLYIIRRLSLPLTYFIGGINRFSKDINAPPIPEIGPRITKIALREFNHMQANLKQLLQARTQMLAAISHDLRTPITRLQLRLENLPEEKTTLKMQQDLSQMETMIQSILTFANHDYQQEVVNQVDLTALLQTIVDDLEELDQQIEFADNNHRIIILGRRIALRRALENIISNGTKYASHLQINLSHKNHQVMIKIIDDGPGIPESELEKVFLPFYRLDKARQSKNSGSGLGLATARDIIRSHGGDISLQNVQGQGLQVTIFLPTIKDKK
ncbi:MAG: ATP-binding protein [Pseudomonadota bacterium]